jgi:cytochrome c
MPKKLTVLMVTLVFVAAMAATAAGQQSPVVDAKAAWWAKQGVNFFKANGKDKALAEFNQPKGKFVQDGLSIYVLDLNGKMVANPNKDLVGKDFMKVKDATGKFFAAEIVKKAKEYRTGWAAYTWEKVDGLIICGAKSGK